MSKSVAGFFVIMMALVARQDDAPPAIPVAQAYLAAYQAQDFDALAALYAEDAVFIDPTSFDVGNITQPIDWQGRDAILSGLRSWNVARLEYAVDRNYQASGRTVFDGAVTAVYALEDGDQHYRFPIITIVTVQDGQVVEHRDYTDYAGMQRIAPAGDH